MRHTASHTRAGVVAAALAMSVIGLQYLVERPEEDALRQFLVVTGLIAAAGAIVFGLVIPRALARGGSARTALTLSLLALLLAVAYWSGVPPVLAVGGVVLARRTSDPAQQGLARVAVGVGALALVADLAVLAANGASG